METQVPRIPRSEEDGFQPPTPTYAPRDLWKGALVQSGTERRFRVVDTLESRTGPYRTQAPTRTEIQEPRLPTGRTRPSVLREIRPRRGYEDGCGHSGMSCHGPICALMGAANATHVRTLPGRLLFGTNACEEDLSLDLSGS